MTQSSNGLRPFRLFVLMFLVSGCAVGPDFQKPDAPTPEGWVRTHPGMLDKAGGLDGFFIARWRK